MPTPTSSFPSTTPCLGFRSLCLLPLPFGAGLLPMIPFLPVEEALFFFIADPALPLPGLVWRRSLWFLPALLHYITCHTCLLYSTPSLLPTNWTGQDRQGTFVGGQDIFVETGRRHGGRLSTSLPTPPTVASWPSRNPSYSSTYPPALLTYYNSTTYPQLHYYHVLPVRTLQIFPNPCWPFPVPLPMSVHWDYCMPRTPALPLVAVSLFLYPCHMPRLFATHASMPRARAFGTGMVDHTFCVWDRMGRSRTDGTHRAALLAFCWHFYSAVLPSVRFTTAYPLLFFFFAAPY